MTASQPARARAVRTLLRLLAHAGPRTAEVTRLVEGLGVSGRLLRAISFAQRGDWQHARADIDAVLSAGDVPPEVLGVAADVLYATRDFAQAIELLGAAIEKSGAAHQSFSAKLLQYASRLGWQHEVRIRLERCLVEQPNELRWHQAALQRHLRARNFATAHSHASACVRLEPLSAHRHLMTARIEVELGQRDQARRSIEAALQLAVDAGERHSAARLLIEAGAFKEAAALLSELAAAGDAAAHIALAWLDLWQGDLGGALEKSHTARALKVESTETRLIEASVAVLRGQPHALEMLGDLVAGQPDDQQSRLWLAEAHLAQRDHAAARREVMRALALGEEYCLAGWLLWVLIDLYEADPQTVLSRTHFDECAPGLLEICPQAEPLLQTGKVAPLTEAVETARNLMSGNRSTTPTYMHNGELRRISARTAPRHASRRALELIRYLPFAEVLQQLDAVIRDFPHSSLPICHRGELHIWFGDSVRARADLNAAIALHRQTRWAYIGLAAADILEGDYERSLSTMAHGIKVMHDTVGPAVFVYRGEALRRLGRIEAAIADLSRAWEINPSRLGALINLGLAYGAAGDTDQLQRCFAELVQRAPGMLTDAARDTGIMLWVQPSAAVAPYDAVRVLERALEMMRGNRSSSCITYFTAQGHLRSVAGPSVLQHGMQQLKEAMRSVLQLESAEPRAFAISSQAAPPADRR